jgi:fibronectin-binding autotransporter adhesin
MKSKSALRHFLALAGSSLLAVSSTHAANIWDGGGGDGNWNTPDNWDDNALPGTGALTFTGDVQTITNNNLAAVNPTFAGIKFTNDGTAGKTNAFTLSGSGITLGGNITGTNVTTGPAITNTIDLDIILNDNRVITPGTNQNIIISGDISETGSPGRNFVLNGNGTVTLTGTNTFTGVLGAQRSTIEINSISDFGVASSVGAGTSGHITLGSANSTATLRYTGGAQTTDRTIQIGNAANTQTGGARIINDGTGALTFDATTFNAAYTNTNVVNRALTLGGTNGGSITGIIQNTSATNTNSVVKIGDGTWTLGGTNTYTAATTVQQGNLVAGSNSLSGQDGAFGNATSEINLGVAGANNNAGILIGGAFNVGRNVRLLTSNTTDAGTRVLTIGGNTAHNSEFSGNIILGTDSQAGRGITLTAASGGQVTFSGVIQNPTSMDATTYTVTKAGLGTVVLSNANTYTGATDVNEGTLLINGSTSSTSLVTVNNGGTLGGTGTIGGSVTLNDGAILSTGASIESLATGSNVWNGGSTFVFEFSTDGSTGAAGTEWDLLSITGTLDLTGASNMNQINFDLITMANATTSGSLGTWDPDASAIWSGFVTTTGGITGFAANLFNIDSTDFNNTINGSFSITQNGNNLDLIYTAVPEPRAAFLGGLGLLALLRRRRN